MNRTEMMDETIPLHHFRKGPKLALSRFPGFEEHDVGVVSGRVWTPQRHPDFWYLLSPCEHKTRALIAHRDNLILGLAFHKVIPFA